MYEITPGDRYGRGAVIREARGPGPPGLSLDRVSPHGNYERGSARWATRRQQALRVRSRLRLLNVAQC